MKVAWHEVPGLRINASPSRRERYDLVAWGVAMGSRRFLKFRAALCQMLFSPFFQGPDHRLQRLSLL
jgi:hypothetical protein